MKYLICKCNCLRCKSFQTAKRGEVCRIPGCSVSPAAPGTPTPVRLSQAPPETFKQFLLYVYTGKVFVYCIKHVNLALHLTGLLFRFI